MLYSYDLTVVLECTSGPSSMIEGYSFISMLHSHNLLLFWSGWLPPATVSCSPSGRNRNISPTAKDQVNLELKLTGSLSSGAWGQVCAHTCSSIMHVATTEGIAIDENLNIMHYGHQWIARSGLWPTE